MNPPRPPTVATNDTVTTDHSAILYPDSDGQPMADNTLQFEWITLLKENLSWIFAQDPQVFVAGDLLWYPVEGNAKIRQAPDTLVAFGRSKGYRGSYQQWKEGNLAPQVVFEVLSPGNRRAEMSRKLLFYNTYGVEEYYLYDPDRNILEGWIRQEGILEWLEDLQDWVSPRLGVRFDPTATPLALYRPDGQRFLSYEALAEEAKGVAERATEADRRATQADRRAAEADRRAAEANQQAAAAQQRADRLAAKLRELGLDPEIL
ncbi:Uma2 family endonuclease [Prochlorothrix hollandica]|uniref:Uma2 family endonuclease n=1 Tax=Prochlorothrix hollandica TaxID=1223 RepID=UPI00334128AD